LHSEQAKEEVGCAVGVFASLFLASFRDERPKEAWKEPKIDIAAFVGSMMRGSN